MPADGTQIEWAHECTFQSICVTHQRLQVKNPQTREWREEGVHKEKPCTHL